MDIPELRNINKIENLNVLFSEEEEEVEVRMQTCKRYIRDNHDLFVFFNEWEFKRRFRFTKDSIILRILPLIEEGLAKVNRGLPISPPLQLLICLQFYATGSFQLVVENVIQIFQPIISRIISQVSTLLASYINVYIKMPVSDVIRSENKHKFQELGGGLGAMGIPSIDGAIDCTHVRLIHTRFQNIDEIYRNRKGYFSLKYFRSSM